MACGSMYFCSANIIGFCDWNRKCHQECGFLYPASIILRVFLESSKIYLSCLLSSNFLSNYHEKNWTSSYHKSSDTKRENTLCSSNKITRVNSNRNDIKLGKYSYDAEDHLKTIISSKQYQYLIS